MHKARLATWIQGLMCTFLCLSSIPAPTMAQQATGSSIPVSTTKGPEAEIFTIGRGYIHPARITRPAGPFLCVIKNSSYLRRLVIHIKNASAADLHQADVDVSGGSWSYVLDLPAGIYQLSEPNNPGLHATLVIQ